MFWVFAFPEGGGDNAGRVLSAVPLTAAVGLLFGLYIKYLSVYGARSYLIVAPMLLLLLGNLVLCFSIGLVWMAGRPDLTAAAVGVAALLVAGCLSCGFFMERRRLRPTHEGLPDVLRPLLDLDRERIHPMPTAAPPPHMAKFTGLAAVVLNVPLLLEIAGGSRASLLWLVFPVSAGAAAWLLGSQAGPGLARALAIMDIERSTGKRFVSGRIDELRDLRRGFWLSRWLAPGSKLNRTTERVDAGPARSSRKR